MSCKVSPLAPRKISISGEVRWEVRVPAELRPRERAARRRFAKEAEAKGYCNRLKADLLQYSDKARGLTDKQKIEAQECFTKLQAYPSTTLTHAVDLLIERLSRASKSFTVSELAGRVIADKEKQGGRGSSARLLREIKERFARFARAFGDRMISDVELGEIRDWLLDLTTRDWLLDLTTIIETSSGKQETDEPVSQTTRQAYKRTLSIGFGWAKNHGVAASNPVADVKLAQPARERVFVFTPEQTAGLLDRTPTRMHAYFALCCFAGLRPEQAQGLSWEHIHFDRGTSGESKCRSARIRQVASASFRSNQT